jgi:hypothetical protein
MRRLLRRQYNRIQNSCIQIRTKNSLINATRDCLFILMPLRVLNRIGLGKSLLVRLPRDISDLKITHDAVNGKVNSLE